MGTITVRFTQPVSEYVTLQNVEIRFMEDGILRVLSLDEWKAYFPGCGDPVVMKRVQNANERVWWGSVTDRLLRMMRAVMLEPLLLHEQQALQVLPTVAAAKGMLENSLAGYQRDYGPTAREEDSEPPTAWTLKHFLGEWEVNCRRYPEAIVSVIHSPDRARETNARFQHFTGRD